MRYSIFKVSASFFLFFSFVFSVQAQSPTIIDSDSLFLSANKEGASFQSVSTLDPNRAALFSAILPGLGQAYNGQYWKIPLIYAGGIIIGHYIDYNHRIYSEFQNALLAGADDDPFTENPYAEFGQTALIRNRDAFRRNRDYLMIIGVGYYLINIVEAHVSAHLHEFDVNDNLSMNISPAIQPTALFSQAIGIKISLNLK
ncbi:MAG: hypothetical protein KI791_17270 [Cyclobacteriaceae bacterium]|nr:hypothetical protein [Cyclobacteriaceae bacterium SS2]